MIAGSGDSIFKQVAQVAKPNPYMNLSKEQAQEIADVYFKSSIEMAIASLRSGLEFAKRTNHLKLVDLLEKDIETYLAIWAEREEDIKDAVLYEEELQRVKDQVLDVECDKTDYLNSREEEKSIEEAQNAWEKRNKL